jgi:hypothetical protein
MNDYREMYAEYCMEVGDRSRLGPGRPESFTEFVAWRKRGLKNTLRIAQILLDKPL